MPWYKKQAIISLLLLCTACTVEQKGASTDAQFHMPFTYQPWKTEQLTSVSGGSACAISSGYNGLTFVVRKVGTQNIVSVQVNRFLPSGAFTTVTVNGHRYEAHRPYFSAQDAVAMAEDFSAGGKAYMETPEIRGYGGRVRYSNVIKLDGFRQLFEQCRN